MRLDQDGRFYVLELNSLPSLGEHGSYVAAAAAMGLDFTALVNRLIEVASARYFGTPQPPELQRSPISPKDRVFAFLTQRRDRLEKRVEQWVNLSSRADDPIGIRQAANEIGDVFAEIGMEAVAGLTDAPSCWGWQTAAKFNHGTLLLLHLDIPFNSSIGGEHFHRDPEWLYGEGIGSSRGPLVQLEYALRAVNAVRKLKSTPLGVICYADEGRECSESASTIARACADAKQVLVLRPGNPGESVVTGRRGQRRYRLFFQGKPVKLGQADRKSEVMLTALRVLEDVSSFTSRKDRVAVSIVDIHAETYPQLLPHRVTAILQASFPHQAAADALERRITQRLANTQAELARLSDRPSMPVRNVNSPLINRLQAVGAAWEIPLNTETSLWPSVAGLVPPHVPVVCGLGPVANSLHTGREALSRISLVQRSLLLAQFLLGEEGRH